MFVAASLAVCLTAALISAAPELPSRPSLLSPCPELFSYDALPAAKQNGGRWTGRLVIKSPEDLRGLWIRLVFDGVLQGVTVDGFESVLSEDRTEVLIKNRDEILLADSPRTLRLLVVYEPTEGGSIPNLVEYRLNARTVCPDPNSNRSDYFHGDSSKDFLPYLHSHVKPIPTEPPFKCSQAPAAQNLHPWAASLYLRHDGREQYACAAALISPSHVITAAHCVTFKNDNDLVPSSTVRVYLGETLNSSRLVEVAQIIAHPGYRAGYLGNNLAILRLSTPDDLSETVAPICVSGGSQDKKPDGAVLVGQVVEENGALGGKVLEASASRIDEAKCVALNPQLNGLLDEGSYCVTYGSDNIQCVGNSGSSYVSIQDNRATLKGIVTLGVRLQNSGDCNKRSVVVIADIEKYFRWIGRVIY